VRSFWFFGWANDIELSEAKVFNQVSEAEKRAKEACAKSAKNLRIAIDVFPSHLSLLASAIAVGRRFPQSSELVEESEGKLKPLVLTELKRGIDHKNIDILRSAISAAEAIQASDQPEKELKMAQQALRKQQEIAMTEKLESAIKANEISALEGAVAEAEALLSFEPRTMQSARDVIWSLKKSATSKALFAKHDKNVSKLVAEVNKARALSPAFDDEILLTSSEALLRELKVQELNKELDSALAIKGEESLWNALRDQQRVAWFCASSKGAAKVDEAWEYLRSAVFIDLKAAIASENASEIKPFLSKPKMLPLHHADDLEEVKEKAYMLLRNTRRNSVRLITKEKKQQNIWDPSGNDPVACAMAVNGLLLFKSNRRCSHFRL